MACPQCISPGADQQLSRLLAAGSNDWRHDPLGFANHLGGSLSHTIASASLPPGSSEGGSSGGSSSGGGGGGSGW
jgi:hypothetical protein